MTTLVLTGAFHDYRHVDLANVPYHLMNEEQVKRLNKDPELQKKIVPTLGVAGNLTRLRIQQEGNIPRFAEELAQYKNGRPTVFFSLGGRVEGPEIQFTMKDAENIWKKAREFQKNGFNVALGNSPRTPTDVTDFLFEKARENGMNFYNAKKSPKRKRPISGSIPANIKKNSPRSRKKSAIFILPFYRFQILSSEPKTAFLIPRIRRHWASERPFMPICSLIRPNAPTATGCLIRSKTNTFSI